MSAKRLYVIGNSHMDPVWLWRLREGRSTWLNTCRTTVRMMKKHPFLKFARSSTAAYKWVEESDPALFADIRALVDAGRWEPVGGWVEQSDTIVANGESLLRQAAVGNAYFKEKFGRPTRIAYCVDSFGQNAGLPKILAASGFDRYVWMRPSDHEMGVEKPHLFKWRGDDGTSLVTCLRIRHGYCTGTWMKQRDDMFRHLDDLAKIGDEHQTFFFGVGDHGGGIYENQLEWLEAYRKDHDVVYSTLDEYFNVLDTIDLPVLDGEHTHHAPGCYSAVSGVKKWMARAERNLHKAEKMLVENPLLEPVQRMAGTLR
ncbi:MAG: alpha-mannosidase, partial [Kiritimatiellaeota bacterium]|nr:alpha-mannosidase [Kiritimatiellota bacterium]